ncbi:hypothetical protein ACJW30_01G329900 [Castanea mollissima]
MPRMCVVGRLKGWVKERGREREREWRISVHMYEIVKIRCRVGSQICSLGYLCVSVPSPNPGTSLSSSGCVHTAEKRDNKFRHLFTSLTCAPSTSSFLHFFFFFF